MFSKASNSNDNNIAIICPTLSRGGAERIVGYLSKQINPYSKNLYIILFNSKEITYSYSGKIINLDFDSDDSITKSKILNRFIKFFKIIKLILKLRKIKKEYKINTSISFMDTPNIVNILSKVNEKVILSVRINKSVQKIFQKVSFGRRIEMMLMKYIYRFADKVVSISEGVKIDLINNFNLNTNQIDTIYNFIEIENIEKKMEEALPSDLVDYFKNHDVLINVGRFEHQKNQLNLIREFKNINEKFTNTRLALIGKGTLESKILKEIVQLGLENKVIVIPYSNNPFKYIKNSKVFILNSLYEGFGNVLLEAMVCKVPIISTNCKSGPSEIIAGNVMLEGMDIDVSYFERGILIPVQNNSQSAYSNKSLFDAVESILTNNELRNGMIENSSEYIKSKYSNEILRKKWIELIFEKDKVKYE